MKAKTHKATAKRFKKTASGQIRHYSQGDNSHLKANKDRGQKARKKGSHVLTNKGDIKKIVKLMNK
ncbi:MAG TPA: bL35 family ribosomal protein [Candidatus Dojkabacteria bacterium]|jgi:large subunit ribosomal protein L35|nr:bL35 family ribosomal protein [Candidatus Dojkabacteria bacterium]